DPAAIKAEVASAIGVDTSTSSSPTTAAKPNPSTAVDVVNAGSMSGLASQVSRALKKYGYTSVQARDRNWFDPNSTTIQYGAGAESDAQNIAGLLGLDTPKQPDSSLQPGHIRVTVDTNYSIPTIDASMEDSLTSSSSTTTTPSKSSSGYSGYGTSTYPTPDQGKPIDGGGVPCVN
ncbi:MAG TPA: LytR C-terminal domain-containing protein, partial [Mycobacterium sp.]|nr:LytR C-terminal domain-containing protein [Mycobacterium sp.]